MHSYKGVHDIISPQTQILLSPEIASVLPHRGPERGRTESREAEEEVEKGD